MSDGLRQGRLDSLCGVYSVVNALRLVRGLTHTDAKRLFNVIIGQLDADGQLAECVIEGMNSAPLLAMLKRNTDDHALEVTMPFMGKVVSLDLFWRETAAFLGERRAVIVRLSGHHDHWTVIDTMTARRMCLHDSDGLVHFNRAHCTTGEPTGVRRHRIHPAQTFFVQQAPE